MFIESQISRLYLIYISELDGRGFESRQGMEICFFTTDFRPSLLPTQPPIQRVPGALSLEVNLPVHEADHFHLVLRTRMRGAIPPLPSTPSWYGVVLS
jgi:hypothetical protein